MTEIREFRVVRRVVTTQYIYINALDEHDALSEAIRSEDFEWKNEPAPQVLHGTEKAILMNEVMGNEK